MCHFFTFTVLFTTSVFSFTQTHIIRKFRPLNVSKYNYVNVTLDKDLPHLGTKGSTIAVKRSFAFHYLIPYELAHYTTRAERIGIELETNYLDALHNIRRTCALVLRGKIGNNLALEFHEPPGKDPSYLLNDIKPEHIIDALRKEGLLTALDLLLPEDVNIRAKSPQTFGTYPVTLNLDKGIEAHLKIIIKPKEIKWDFLP
ncbi:conserved Plasmodium protein, unknown function [Babesia microti strain RI]|uniref:Ribosomal protein L9 domain-containing protein n=1 Tax=Babesia microti (strain RI) TaxID=1133968 RepID=A0A1N6LY26_BABMR|nr:conserved Plasmodium protein, unknown function [Babesia microti strain RI]SIO73767.1 conserved Plasmodium protein, unknown function [Babesia microti strain RI]|eukprot:XP_021337829.1 conserved Plasmodium protein, unknown function [Babesia microti strain RI]